MASSPRGRTGGRFRFRLGEPAQRPDGRAGPGPCSPRALELLQPPPGWRLELRQPAAAMHSPFSPLGELPLTGGVTFQTLFLRLTEGVLALCRKRIPRKRPLRYLPTEEPTVPVAACDSISPRTQIRPASPLLVLRCCPSPRVLERDPASRGVGTRSPKPAACNRPPVPAAPCAPLVRPVGVCGRSAPQDSHVRCKYPGHLAPLSQEPPRGEASPLRPALVWLAREEHALSGAPELCVL